MPALITELIDKVDNAELVRDQIAAILVLESAAQQALAAAAKKDPRLWALRVYLERDAPWQQWLDLPGELEVPPIVAVSFEASSADGAASSVVDRQKVIGTFNLDCYGYGVATETALGHEPGDMRAAFVCQRAVRLARNILMSGQYTYLGLRGIVGRRWVQNTTAFQPALEGHVAQQVVGCRISFQADFLEYSPQVLAQELEVLSIEVQRAPDGELVLLTAQYGEEEDDS